MRKNEETLSNFVIEISVFLFLLFVMVKSGLAIEHNMPKETLGDKLLIVLAYMGGFIAVYFITKIIYTITSGPFILHPNQTACLFVWFGGSLISLFRIFVG
ncbi:MAG: hypothetical protein LBL65_07605 [Campylobacteraceae bacterium]|jgi:hypothetical protein|nr:hypothetical protein [Campylobacteraceae bacterium]